MLGSQGMPDHSKGAVRGDIKIRSHAHAVTDCIYCSEPLGRPRAAQGFWAVNTVSYCLEGTS